MKIMLDIDSNSNIIKPKNGDVILYNGKDEKWHIINSDELFAKEKQIVNDLKRDYAAQLNQIRNEWINFKKELIQQNNTMLSSIEKTILNKGEK